MSMTISELRKNVAMAICYNHVLGIPLSELRPDLWPEKEGKTDE